MATATTGGATLPGLSPVRRPVPGLNPLTPTFGTGAAVPGAVGALGAADAGAPAAPAPTPTYGGAVTAAGGGGVSGYTGTGGMTTAGATAANKATASAPQFYTDPNGQAYQWNTASGAWDKMAARTPTQDEQLSTNLLKEQWDAAHRANAVASQLGANSDNPQQVTGTTHTIGNLGTGSVSGSKSGSSSGAGGGDGSGLSSAEIMGIIDKLKGSPMPRETAPEKEPMVAPPIPAAAAPGSSLGFARYKDQAGRIGTQALRALKDQMTERGISGSGIEGELAGGVVGEMGRGLSDAAYQQQKAAEDQQWEAAKLGYQGAIGQRGQNLGLATDVFGGGVTQRGQDVNQQGQLLSLAPTILSLMSRRY